MDLGGERRRVGDRGGGGIRGVPARAHEIFPHVRGSGAISGGLSRAGRLAAGEGLPRRKDGSDRGCVDRAARAGRNGAAGGKALDALLPAVDVLQPYFSPLNVFRYITVRTVYA